MFLLTNTQPITEVKHFIRVCLYIFSELFFMFELFLYVDLDTKMVKMVKVPLQSKICFACYFT